MPEEDVKAAPQTDAFKDVSSKIMGLAGVSLPDKGQVGVLLDRAEGRGLRIDYVFSRNPSVYGKSLNSITLNLFNDCPVVATNIRVGEVKLAGGKVLRPFDEIAEIAPQGKLTSKIHVDFKSTEPLHFEICAGIDYKFPVRLAANVGELVRRKPMSHDEFHKLQKSMGGMNETTVTIKVAELGKVVSGCLLSSLHSALPATLVSALPSALSFALSFALSTAFLSPCCPLLSGLSYGIKEQHQPPTNLSPPSPA